mmetsp:Transcript_56199/g.114673  ORF Transcript_56199/g.114673 Transcript_56199/m.114673 type:complete len:96 (-) Transcript_56199:79-366(-)
MDDTSKEDTSAIKTVKINRTDNKVIAARVIEGVDRFNSVVILLDLEDQCASKFFFRSLALIGIVLRVGLSNSLVRLFRLLLYHPVAYLQQLTTMW